MLPIERGLILDQNPMKKGLWMGSGKATQSTAKMARTDRALMLRFRRRILGTRHSMGSSTRSQGTRRVARRIANSSTGGSIARIDTYYIAKQGGLRSPNLSITKRERAYVSQRAEYQQLLAHYLHALCKPMVQECSEKKVHQSWLTARCKPHCARVFQIL
jgi:hypothetical protein